MPCTSLYEGEGVLLSTRICMIPDFSLFTLMPFSAHQDSNVRIVLRRLVSPSTTTAMSSAKAKVSKPCCVSRSSSSETNRTYNFGESADPYCRPFVESKLLSSRVHEVWRR